MGLLARHLKIPLPALRVALLYVIVAGIWILVSDRVLTLFVTDPSEFLRWQSYKGLLFVLVMALLLYVERAQSLQIRSENKEFAGQQTALFDLAPNPMWMFDLDTYHFMEVNQAAIDHYGYSYEEFMGLNLFDVRVDKQPQQLEEEIKLLKTQESIRYELQHRTKTGKQLDVDVSLRRISWKGKTAGLSTIIDISEQKLLQSRLRESNESLDAIVQAAPLAIISLDQAGRVTSWNTAAERILGWTEKEALGNFPPYLQEKNMPEFHLLLQRVLKGESLAGLELHRIRKNGTPIVISLHAAPMYHGGQDPIGVMDIISDITERKKDEEELRSTKEILSKLMDYAPLPIFVADLDHRIKMTNRAWEQTLETNPTRAIGKKINEITTDLTAEQIIRNNQQVIESNRHLNVEEQLETTDGLRYFQTIKFPLHDLTSEIEAVGGISIDVTERKLAADKLQKLNLELEQRVVERTSELAAKNAELETFTYSVSHDLKAPLRGIDGYSRLLLENYNQNLDEEGREFLQTIRRSVGQMSQLIDDLLAYSRLERRKLTKESVEIQRLLDAILARFSEEIQSRAIEINIDLPYTHVFHDNESLFQALHNLVENALKFSRGIDHPKISIGGSQSEAWQILWVRDNGPGFDMQYHDRIFEIFQRLHRSEDYPGTGIGLAIVRKAIQRVGGRVWAESIPGEGTTFYIQIPKPQPPPQQPGM